MEPLERFPEKVWQMIFDHIEDDKSKFNFLKMHPYFQEKFEMNYAELGFSFVLPVLLDYFEKMKPKSNWELHRERRQSILSCRLVSRKCCEAVDNWLETHWEKEICCPRILWKEKEFESTDLGTRVGVNKFMQHFGELQENRMPILSRSIKFMIPLIEDDDSRSWNAPKISAEQEAEENERRNEILAAIGEGIKFLNVDLSLDTRPSNHEESEWLVLGAFQAVLELVPNLKSLSTFWQKIYFLDWEDQEMLLEFPDLPHLVKLSISPSELEEEDEEMEEEMREELVPDLSPFEKYFPQLVHFTLSGLDCWKDEYVERGRFPKLRHLKLLDVLPEYCNHRRKLLRICRNLFAPNLETFTVHLHYSYSGYSEKKMKRKAQEWIRELVALLNKTFKRQNIKWEGSQGKENSLEFKRI